MKKTTVTGQAPSNAGHSNVSGTIRKLTAKEKKQQAASLKSWGNGGQPAYRVKN